ncbi:adenylyl-sulfate kinase [Burkholderia sp. Ap-962]|uniref:adenylyl-sulfate kinase n=1 Tax=Burkholderia sp. Ap-962 TaxID=2608333 RepID=UPI001D42EAA4|nr:adenylyl-sulfate kinase [Burkholderia sp. Ap-962]
MDTKVCGFAVFDPSLPVDAPNREDLAGASPRGVVVWLTGLSGAGKTTLAEALAANLRRLGRFSVVLDGDRMRARLSRDLGFSEADRFENVRRIAEVAALVAEADGIAIVAAISPLAAMRDAARALVGERFREVYVSTSLAVCEARDPKGLYARARRGELPGFTGVAAPYEPPVAAELVIDTVGCERDACVDALLWFTLDASAAVQRG